MGRLANAAQSFEPNCKGFVRVGGDDPFISCEGIVQLITNMTEKAKGKENIGMLYNSYNNGIPYGCAAEIFEINTFRKVHDYISKEIAE